jgi:hypothetical protein
VFRIFTKLKPAQQLFVKDSYTKSHENPTNSSVDDNRSYGRTDVVSTKAASFLLREERITFNGHVNPVWYLTRQSATSTIVEHYVQKRRKQLILIRNIITFLHDLNMLPA